MRCHSAEGFALHLHTIAAHNFEYLFTTRLMLPAPSNDLMPFTYFVFALTISFHVEFEFCQVPEGYCVVSDASLSAHQIQ